MAGLQEMHRFFSPALGPVLLGLALIALAGCRKPPAVQDRSGMANPASVYCIQQGGQLEIRTGPDGGQFGVCRFDDGSECEEWAFFRGECKKGQAPRPPEGPKP
jgi:putative hemolysin